MKTCRVCKEALDEEEFHKNKYTKDGMEYTCKGCRKTIAYEDYRDKWFLHTCRLKKSESKRKGIPFDLTEEYLESIWTDTCPVFNKPFVKHDKTNDYSPALDRIIPSKGYTKGNVVYISARANRIKYDATVD